MHYVPVHKRGHWRSRDVSLCYKPYNVSTSQQTYFSPGQLTVVPAPYYLFSTTGPQLYNISSSLGNSAHAKNEVKYPIQLSLPRTVWHYKHSVITSVSSHGMQLLLQECPWHLWWHHRTNTMCYGRIYLQDI